MSELLNRIAIEPAVCGGRPCIKGTRIRVSLVLDFLADGMTAAPSAGSTRPAPALDGLEQAGHVRAGNGGRSARTGCQRDL